ncbi:MAG: GNAT family N-acetyltransferase [Asticcacaulis sp.]
MALDTLTLDYIICPEAPGLNRRIEEMNDRAFGPGRFVKTAERLREDSKPLPDLSFVAWNQDRLIGSVRLWSVFVFDEASNTYEPLAFLGPIVVDPAYRGIGIGKAMMRTALDAAFAKGLNAVLLVGSKSYFEPFGFEDAKGIVMPGPVDPKRVLIAYRHPAGEKLRGKIVKVI